MGTDGHGWVAVMLKCTSEGACAFFRPSGPAGPAGPAGRARVCLAPYSDNYRMIGEARTQRTLVRFRRIAGDDARRAHRCELGEMASATLRHRCKDSSIIGRGRVTVCPNLQTCQTCRITVLIMRVTESRTMVRRDQWTSAWERTQARPVMLHVA